MNLSESQSKYYNIITKQIKLSDINKELFPKMEKLRYQPKAMPITLHGLYIPKFQYNNKY